MIITMGHPNTAVCAGNLSLNNSPSIHQGAVLSAEHPDRVSSIPVYINEDHEGCCLGTPMSACS